MMINTESGEAINGQKNVSVLDSALKSGLVFEYSCRTGQCGACKVTLLEGEVDELQSQLALSDDDLVRRKILTCCCAPKTDILIDAEDLTVLKDIKVKTLPARISLINQLSEEIVEVVLRFPASADFKFLEGQYIDVILNSVRRSYSISSTAVDKEVTLLIKRVKQGVMSDYWFSKAKVNDLLRIEGPKGTFFLRATNKPLVFLATGTGIAPIMSILKKLDRHTSFNQSNDIHLFWGNRLAENFIWQPDFNNISVEIERVVSKPDSGWDGKTGYIQDISLDILGEKVRDSDVYACGSNDMIQSAKLAFKKVGHSEKCFYSDAFVQSY